MYCVKVKGQFSSAHNLRGYKGKCEDLHGHNWHVEVTVCRDGLDEIGMVMDFRELKDMVADVIGRLDHKHLNELEGFTRANPTSENIARYIHDRIVEKTPGIKVGEVVVWETDSSAAIYREGAC
ncbi:MAG: 6-carboxytetrahydropterin synthase QueD [Candidatus Omnitrophica bacterium]|nr:6-carboxytetrahydropterin synthase QueD [Candidatus Omnitrophota bacterium]MDD5487605.1 6-carboxytetrahydropterin synthase QueD [Candidatus Omnitrophota bacterium]